MSNQTKKFSVETIEKPYYSSETGELVGGSISCWIKEGETKVAMVSQYVDGWEARARLIAAAPMLLFRLKQEHGHCIMTCCDVCAEIAKAEGRSG